MVIKGRLILPGDKSISHRALMLAALTDGDCVIHNISTGEDVESTRNCLTQCGIKSIREGATVRIKGGEFKNPKYSLDCGNSGTTVRLLAGLLAGGGLTAEFNGDSSLSSRPMNRIIEPLTEMGVNIESNNGCLPLKILTSKLKGINYTLPVDSAQVKSSILLAGLGAKGQTTVTEKIKTRDHSELMLSELGTQITTSNKIILSPLKKPLNTFEISVPGDPSSAAFFAAAAAIIPNSDITIQNVLANPTRVGFFSVLEEMGAGVIWKNIKKECGELTGDVQIYSQPLNGIDITPEIIPGIIDEIPIIAILATQAKSPTIVSGAGELRVKECDRIKAICSNLKSMGAEVIETRDGFIINPVNILQNTTIKTFGDHRIAMAFTVAGLVTPEPNKLDDPECINISFPEFNEKLSELLDKPGIFPAFKSNQL